MSQRLSGIPISPGIAIGPAWWLQTPTVATRHSDVPLNPETERARLEAAREQAKRELAAILADQQHALPPESLAILEAQQLMLDDPDLLQHVTAAIDAGQSASDAWRNATDAIAAQLSALPDPYFQARAADVRDIQQRVLRCLGGVAEEAVYPTTPHVLLADDLVPSQTVTLPLDRILGIALVGGGLTSHAAILARARGLPAVAGLGRALHTIAPETLVILDGDRGEVIVNPDEATLVEAQARQAAWHAAQKAAAATAAEPGQLADGTRIEIAANIGSAADARAAVQAGAEGVGLLRTEFLYLDRVTPPSTEEQFAIYQEIFTLLEGRPVVVRTFDIGGDKPAPYLSLPPEANPFLGVRAIRLARQQPALLDTQLDALLRTGYPALRIMFPMVATIAEIHWLRERVDAAIARLTSQGLTPPPGLQIGMMVEIPAAALLAEHFAAVVDFFSIGTNDLAQYTLAADRTNPAVAALADALHPAVLRLIQHVVSAAHPAGRWVGVCGELAGDPVAAPILVGLGIDELSMAPAAIPAVKAVLRQWTRDAAEHLAQEALRQESAEAVRQLVQAMMPHR